MMFNLLFLPFFLAATSQPTTTPSVTVTSEQVCRVQHAIRWKAVAWQPWMCRRVADATNAAAQATGQPADILLAVQINESDLRPWAQRWYGSVGPGAVGDLGLMGIRCRIGPDKLCSNGIVRGMKYPEVMRLETNIMLGARILARGWKAYNAGEGYETRVRAICAALNGVRVRAPTVRVRGLISLILASHAEPQS